MIQATPTHPGRPPANCATCEVRSCCFGQDADTGAVEQLNRAVEARLHLGAGEYLYRIGDPFRSLYAVRTGCLKNSLRDDRGQDHVMGFHMMGDIVGVGGIGQDAYIFDVCAVEPSEVCEIPFERLEQLAVQVPALSKSIIKVFGRYRNRDARAQSLRREDSIGQKLSGFLMDFCRRFEARGMVAEEFRLPMPLEDIASYLWAGQKEVEQEMARLADRGILRMSGRTVHVTDLAALKRLAAASG